MIARRRTEYPDVVLGTAPEESHQAIPRLVGHGLDQWGALSLTGVPERLRVATALQLLLQRPHHRALQGRLTDLLLGHTDHLLQAQRVVCLWPGGQWLRLQAVIAVSGGDEHEVPWLILAIDQQTH
ncbi:hypothetical protein D3C84_856320 [compost metagenome]